MILAMMVSTIFNFLVSITQRAIMVHCILPTRLFTNFSLGGTRMARGDIRLVHGHTKSTLITYFSGMKIDPKYTFLHAFFLILSIMSFPKICLYDQKHTLFSNFARFYTPKQCTWVQCLVLKNNPNYVDFWMSLIPPWHSSGPPGNFYQFCLINEQIFKRFYKVGKKVSTQRNNYILHFADLTTTL